MEGEKKKRCVGETIIEPIENLHKKKNEYRYFTKCAVSVEKRRKLPPQARIKRYIYKSLEIKLRLTGKPTQDSFRMRNPLNSAQDIQTLKQLSKGIQRLKLDLYPKDGVNVKKESVRLREVLKRYHGLRTMYIGAQNGINVEQLEDFSEGLKKLSSVRNFEIDFGKEGDFAGAHLETLGQFIKKMSSLKRFGLKYGDPEEVTKERLTRFSRELKRLRSLEHSNLAFPVFERDVFEALGSGLKGLGPQTGVNLQFYQLFMVNNKTIGAFQQALQACDFLPNLGLEFNSTCQIVGSGVELLRQSLETLYLLKHFSFFFTSGVLETMQEAFIKELANLSSLESLHVQFDPRRNIERKLVLMSQTVKKLHLLQDLSLMCGSPSVEGLNALSQIFEELPSLKNIDLTVLYMYQMKPLLTKEGFSALKDGLRKARPLEKMTLYLSYFSEVDDQDIKELMENLEKLTSLKQIAIYFEKFPKLTEEGIDAISQSLKRMQCLQRVKLGFFECSKVNKQSVDTLVQNLKELPFKICCSLNWKDILLELPGR